jgi:CheY-like chemotaxis protein
VLSNAAKFTPAGGRITVRTAATDDGAVIRVRDTGSGIAKDRQQRVFVAFPGEDGGSAHCHGGFGIGLTLAKRVVELHGGAMWLESDGVNSGSEVFVRLPMLPAQADAVAHADAETWTPRLPVQLRILVVEDNVDAAESFQLLLEMGGHDVKVCFNAERALDVVAEFVPHVAFIDIGLPGMNGLELAQRLRRDRRLVRTLLVALSGYGREDDKVATRAAGFDHHLIKPVDLNAVSALLVGQGAALFGSTDASHGLH